MFLPHPRVKFSIVGSLRDREVACSASDRQGSNFESCVWRTVSSQSSHHPKEVLLAQFSLCVHKGGLKPDSFQLPVGTADAPATRTPCVRNNEQNTTRLTDPSKSKQNNETNIMYLNARSLKSVTTNVNKVRDFSAFIELSQSDIYGITETWLNSNILDSELFPEHYIVYHKDREHTVQHKRGGGILMVFKKRNYLASSRWFRARLWDNGVWHASKQC